MTLEEFNALPKPAAESTLLDCCTASRWAASVAAKRPYSALSNLLSEAQEVWQTMEEGDLLEAFAGHPKIGDVSSLKAKYRSTEALASDEQSGVNTATEATLAALAEQNQHYEAKYGFIFIVFATGKSAEQMLALLLNRINNTREQELVNAAAAQACILDLRLKKLFGLDKR